MPAFIDSDNECLVAYYSKTTGVACLVARHASGNLPVLTGPRGQPSVPLPQRLTRVK